MESFEKIAQFMKLIGFEIVLFIAGVLGAFVSQTAERDLNLWQRVSAVLSGGIIANYITPVVLDIINLSESISYGLAFIMGYMGLKSVEYTIIYIKRKLKGNDEV